MATRQKIVGAERLLVDFLNNSEIGFAIFDDCLRYQAVNPWLAATHGIPAELHFGKHLREVIGEVALRVEPALKQTLMTGRPIFNFEVEGTLPTKRERKRWIGNFFPLKDANGGIKQVAAIVAELATDAQVETAGKHDQLTRVSSAADLLRSWKEIAGYLGTCAKTVQRWERGHDLPVRRVTTGKGAVVFALRSELDSWMRTHTAKKITDQR